MARLTAHGVGVRIGHRDVLRDVDVEVQAGEWVALIGPNGAGKTTLLRAVADLSPHSGQVLIDGQPSNARNVAMVVQSPILPDRMTVAEYTLLGRTAHVGRAGREIHRDHEVVASVLECLGLLAFADRYVTSLSGGEAQRVVIARALAQQTGVLLLDEPTSALDLGHRDAVLTLIDELRRNDHLAVVAAMHDLTSAAVYADRLVLIADGVVVASGCPADVLRDDVLSAAYGAPLRVRDVDGVPIVLGMSR